MNDDPLAPKLGPDTLGKIMGDVRRRDTVKRHSVPVASPAENKFCDVCSKVYHHEQILAGPDMMSRTCDECQSQLDQGAIVVISPRNEFSFCWGIGAVGLPQKNRVSQAEYDAIVKHAIENKIEQKLKEGEQSE